MDEIERARELLARLSALDIELGKKRNEEMDIQRRFVDGLGELVDVLAPLIVATKIREGKG